MDPDPAPAPEAARAIDEAALAPAESSHAASEDACALPDLMDLETAQRVAIEGNPSLLAVAEQVAQAGELVKQARSLYFPQVDADYTAAHTWLADTTTQQADTDDGRLTRQTRRSSDVPDFSTPFSDLLTRLGLFPDISLLSETAEAALRVQDDIKQLIEGVEGQAPYALGETVDSYTLDLTAGFLVFDGFSRKCTYAIARFGRRETEAARLEAQRLLLGAVARTFYGVQLARKSMETAEADQAFNKRLLNDAKERRKVGKGPTSDVLNFEVRLRMAQAALLVSKGEYEAARIALAVLMGLPEGFLPARVRLSELTTETAEDMVRPEADPLIRYALEHRPSILQSGYSVERAKATVKQRSAEYYPKVSAFARHEARRYDDSRFDEDDFSTSVGVNVSYNLFAGGRRRARVAEAQHAHRQAEHRLDEEELKVVSDVRNAILKLKITQEQLVLQRTAAEYVEKNRDFAAKAYDAGKGPLALLNQAQRDLTQAQVQLALAQVSLKQSWYDLRTATGQTLDAFALEE